jgi:hypothetical protein
MAFDVFISYSTQDKPTADATCAALEGAGIRCWIAPRDIRPGGQYGGAIIAAIDSCRVMVLVFSQSANASHQVPREVERAVIKGVPIVPLRVEDVVPTDSMAYFLESVHWLDAINPPLAKHLQYLVDTVRSILAVPSPEKVTERSARLDEKSNAGIETSDNSGAGAQSAAVQKKPAPARLLPMWQLALAAGICCLIVAALVLGHFLWPSSAMAQSPANVLKGLGLTGHWAMDCSSPASPTNNWDTYSEQPSGNVERRIDLGPGYKENVYIISAAKNLGNNQVSMNVLFNGTTDEEIVVSVIGGKEHTISTKLLQDGTYLVQNGVIPRSGVATPTLSRCN